MTRVSRSRPSRKVYQKGCIRVIFYFYPIGSDFSIITKFTEKLFGRVNFADEVPTSSDLYECLLKDGTASAVRLVYLYYYSGICSINTNFYF